MAEFDPAFDVVILNEGGFRLTDIRGDKGGQTYAGISRKRNPDWSGWRAVDAGETPDTSQVRAFYKHEYWDRVRGDDVTDSRIAQSLFDFAVNAGPVIAIKLAQAVCGVVCDGQLGPRSLEALNGIIPDTFVERYALAKVARYAAICNKDRAQSKFLLGWINRTLKGIA